LHEQANEYSTGSTHSDTAGAGGHGLGDEGVFTRCRGEKPELLQKSFGYSFTRC
jgi:hypothetical protein